MKTSKNNFKEDFKKHPVGFSLAFAGLLIVAMVVLSMNIGPVSHIWPSKTAINEKKDELKEKQHELQEAIDRFHLIEQNEKSFIKNNTNFWINERDGDPKINIQKRINNTAAEHGFTLSSVGAVRANKITDGVSLMNTSIRGEGPIKNLTEFLGELQDMKPRFYWKSFLLRPKNPNMPDNIMLSGNIQLIAIDEEKLTRLLIDKK